jgi:hypothetical protein
MIMNLKLIPSKIVLSLPYLVAGAITIVMTVSTAHSQVVVNSVDFAIITNSASDFTEPAESQGMKRAWQHQAFNRFSIDAAADTIGGIHVDDIQSVHFQWSIVREQEPTFIPYVWALDNGVTTDDNTTFPVPGTAVTEDNWTSTLTGETWDNVTTGQIYNSTSRTGDVFPDPASPVTRLARENLGDIGNAYSNANSGVFETTAPYNVNLELDLAGFKNLITSDTGNNITLIFSQQDSGGNGFAYAVPGNTNPDWLSPQLVITAIPEPSSFVLMMLGLGGLALLRRRQK